MKEGHMQFHSPSPPYIGPAKFHGGAQTLKPLKRIVIHGTVSKCVPGGARATAAYFRKTVTRPSSAHYVVDPTEVVQVVGDHQVAYHAPPNKESIGIEHCDPVAGPSSRWQDSNHKAMLLLSARTVAALCLAFDLPIRKVSPLQLRLGFRGICGHADVSAAWKQTNHSDPGDGFPWDHYISLVKAEARKIKAGPQPPPPPPKPVPPLPAKHGVQLHLVTGNVKNLPDLTREQVRADTFAIHRLGSIVMWQEIAEQEDREDLEHSCPLERYEHVGLTTEVPITVLKKKWSVRRSGTLRLHAGKTGVSPARFVTWAEVAHHNDDALPSFIVMNTHYVSGAFTHPGQAAEEWRVSSWEAAHKAQSDLVAKFLADGFTVLGGGDFNRNGTFEGFSPHHRWLMHGGLDHLWCAEAAKGVKVGLDSTGTLGTDHLYTDHAARWALVTFSKG